MRRRAPFRRVDVPLLLALGLSACASAPVPSKPVAEFPSQAALQAIEVRPAARPELPQESQAGEGWTLEDALPVMVGDAPWEPAGVWDAAFVDALRGAERPPRVTQALSCTAREMGRFVLEHGALPPAGLRRFMTAVCGSVISVTGFAFAGGELPPTATDEEALARWGDAFREQVLVNLKAGAQIAGFSFEQRGSRVAASAVFGVEAAQIKPFSPVPDARGEVTIEGRMLVPAAHVEAYVNRGRFGVARCDVDLSVQRPSFRVFCRPHPADRTAWIQLVYAPPRRVLGAPFAEILARRPGEIPVYRPESYSPSRPVESAAQFTRVMVEQLNAARAAAGLGAVALAPRQTATATRLAPHFFAGSSPGGAQANADLIALGLLAGWEVDGVIRSGSFVASYSTRGLDAGLWLTGALERPMGRVTLLAPDIEQIAVGPFLSRGPDGVGAMVTGYRFHHGSDHTEDVNRLLVRVIEARRRMRLLPPMRLSTMDEVLKEELGLVHAGESDTRSAMNAVLARAVERFGSNMRCFAIETMSLDALELPPELLRQQALHLDIGVTHHRPKGAAWAQYVVLVVFADYSGNEV